MKKTSGRPIKPAVTPKKAMPARSNKGGAVRGKARAAQVRGTYPGRKR